MLVRIKWNCLPLRNMFINIVILLLLAINTHVAVGLYIPGKEMVYEYHAIIRTGTLTPVLGSSDWEIIGNLEVQSHENQAFLKLSNLSVSLFNGKPRERPKPEHYFKPIPTEATEIQQPFMITYDGGIVKSITVSKNENTWSVNIKRAIASILQLDETKLKQVAFTSSENNLYGDCIVGYTVSNEENTIFVRKFIDHDNCKNYPKMAWSNVSPLFCAPGKKIVTATSGRVYELLPLGEHFKLINVKANSGVDIQPFQALGELNYAFVNQSLKLKSIENIEHPLVLSQQTEELQLTYEIPGSDLTQGRSPSDTKHHIEVIDTYLEKISRSLEINMTSGEIDVLHNEYTPHLLYFMSLISTSDFKEYYNTLAIGTSYHQETLRNLFLKSVSQVGSYDAIIFIRDLILSGEVKDQTAIEMLMTLPFYMRNPTEELLRNCEVFLSLEENVDDAVKQSATLTFSIMVYKICIRGCSPELLERYIQYFVEHFSSASTYNEQLLYLEALNNIEIGSTFDYVLPIIRGNVTILTKQPHHIRFLGVWATMSRAPFRPAEVYQLYWPILTNRSEHLEMRVAALTMLILSGPTHGNFVNLLWFMQSEHNAHLLHFYYTTLESLIDTQYPCYTHLGTLASHIIRYVRPPHTRNWATGNYILDYSNPKYGFGGLAQLFAVASQRTGNPNVFYLLINNHALGHNVRQYALYLKLEGVSEAVSDMLFKLNMKSVKVIHLANILQQIKAPKIAPEEIHIEIIAKVEERVVYCQYINHTNFHKLTEVITKMNFLSKEFHVNFQSVKAPIIMETTLPTDMGVPLLLRTDSSVITSVRGNFTKHNNNSTLSRQTQIDFRYHFSTGSSILVYNPILNMWHTSRRSLSYYNYVPFNHHISIHPKQQQIKFSFANPAGTGLSFVAHTRSSVLIQNEHNSIDIADFCPTCKNPVIVVQNDKQIHNHELLNYTLQDIGINIYASIFDCEHSFSPYHFGKLLGDIMSPRDKNHRVLLLSRPLLGLIHVSDLLMYVPPKGSCGLGLELTSNMLEDTEIDGSLQMSMNGTLSGPSRKYVLQIALILKDRNSKAALKSWHGTTVYEVSREDTKHALKIRVARSSEGKLWQKTCFEGETIFPKQSNGLRPWKPSEDVTAKANIVWGPTNKTCPKNGAELHIVSRGEVTKDLKDLSNNLSGWSHEACLEDSKNTGEWGEGYTPITEACYRAAVDVATLRKYTATITHKNLPQHVISLGKQIAALVGTFDYDVKIDSPDEFQTFTTVIEVPATHPHVTLKVNDRQLTFYEAVPLLEPFLINTCVNMYVPQAMKFGVLGSCVVNMVRVTTIDNSTREIVIPSCYTMVAGDCTNAPHFAVFVKKVSESKPLAVKVYVDGQTVEILPEKKGNLQIYLNGNKLNTDKQGHYFPPGEKIYDFLVQQLEDGLVRITSEMSKIWMQHNGHFLTLVVPSIYRGHMCGLCGDFNGDASNDSGDIISFNCEDK